MRQIDTNPPNRNSTGIRTQLLCDSPYDPTHQDRASRPELHLDQLPSRPAERIRPQQTQPVGKESAGLAKRRAKHWSVRIMARRVDQVTVLASTAPLHLRSTDGPPTTSLPRLFSLTLLHRSAPRPPFMSRASQFRTNHSIRTFSYNRPYLYLPHIQFTRNPTFWVKK